VTGWPTRFKPKNGRGVSPARFLLNLFFPRTCPLCRGDVPAEAMGSLCPPCRDSFPRWTGLACRVCGIPLPDGGARCGACRRRRRAFRFCRSAGLYEGTLRQALLLFKFGGRDDLASVLALDLFRCWRGRPELRDVDAVVPVPLHPWREFQRGYNPAELLARGFCRWSGVPLLGRGLVRVRSTRAQARLRREARFTNVHDAFTVRERKGISGKRVLVVDDVCTTGATLESCARALKAAGVRSVSALTLARQAHAPTVPPPPGPGEACPVSSR
jgi:ComF family protein